MTGVLKAKVDGQWVPTTTQGPQGPQGPASTNSIIDQGFEWAGQTSTTASGARQILQFAGPTLAPNLTYASKLWINAVLYGANDSYATRWPCEIQRVWDGSLPIGTADIYGAPNGWVNVSIIGMIPIPANQVTQAWIRTSPVPVSTAGGTYYTRAAVNWYRTL